MKSRKIAYDTWERISTINFIGPPVRMCFINLRMGLRYKGNDKVIS